MNLDSIKNYIDDILECEDELLEIIDKITDKELHNYFECCSYRILLCISSIEHSLNMMGMLSDIKKWKQKKWYKITLEKCKNAEMWADRIAFILTNPKFSYLFDKQCLREVDILNGPGKFHGRPDRIIIKGNDIWIIDFKTDFKAVKDWSAMPNSYIKQLERYAELLNDIYPGKTVYKGILWVVNASITWSKSDTEVMVVA